MKVQHRITCKRCHTSRKVNALFLPKRQYSCGEYGFECREVRRMARPKQSILYQLDLDM